MAATPVLDDLNVKLAYRLGDPYAPGTGAVVTATDDGIAYPAALRDAFLTDALRAVVTRYGARALRIADMREAYCPAVEVTTNPEDLPADLHRILAVNYYGKKAISRPFIGGLDNSVYWQNVPFYQVQDGQIYFWNVNNPVFTASVWYQRTIPNLTHNGVEDILLGPMFYPHILSFAEALGRRTHQELGPHTKQDAIGELQSMKDTD